MISTRQRWAAFFRGLVLLGVVLLAALPLAHGLPAAALVPGPAVTINDPDLFIYVPANAALRQPLRVLVAVHSMGGSGSGFAQDLLVAAEEQGWVVVAPTFKYQDYKNPTLVLQDDLAYLPRLATILDDLPARIGLATREQVLLYGHSRGGQFVHRFATVYPERVLGVAVLAAGSYTLPQRTAVVDSQVRSLPLPYGIADIAARLGREFDGAAFARIPFRIEVGADDTNPGDAPRAWDTYIGVTRVDRACAYAQILADRGMRVTLEIYGGAGHLVTTQMHDDALHFLANVAAGHGSVVAAGPRTSESGLARSDR